MRTLLTFLYHYPLFMACLWMLGALTYLRRRTPKASADSKSCATPPLSVLIPCHNEGDVMRETIARMVDLDYPDYEVIVIDDGSTDHTPRVLAECAAKHPRLRVVTLKRNQGKGTALKFGLLASRTEFLVCIDADAFLDRQALRPIMWHFVNFSRVGAVTGNPRIRNRTTLLGKIQVSEYSSIVGMIKRTQRILGKVFTVSGVAAAYRKSAILDVGLWSDDMVTEDIDVTWKLQTRFWDVRYEEKALCWILTPETVAGLWKQRVRWAQGGAEVMLKYIPRLLDYRQRRFWPVCIEYLVSVFWSYLFFFCCIVAVLNGLGMAGLIRPLPEPWSFATIVPPEWTGTLLACICMLQAFIALLFERQAERGITRYIFWFIWYPIVYWILSAAATAWGLPKALMKPKGQRAVWTSPDRGLQ